MISFSKKHAEWVVIVFFCPVVLTVFSISYIPRFIILFLAVSIQEINIFDWYVLTRNDEMDPIIQDFLFSDMLVELFYHHPQ